MRKLKVSFFAAPDRQNDALKKTKTVITKLMREDNVVSLLKDDELFTHFITALVDGDRSGIGVFNIDVANPKDANGRSMECQRNREEIRDFEEAIVRAITLIVNRDYELNVQENS